MASQPGFVLRNLGLCCPGESASPRVVARFAGDLVAEHNGPALDVIGGRSRPSESTILAGGGLVPLCPPVSGGISGAVDLPPT
jgi:hypothetical protein